MTEYKGGPLSYLVMILRLNINQTRNMEMQIIRPDCPSEKIATSSQVY